MRGPHLVGGPARTDPSLSRGARVCLSVISAARPRKGGRRVCGQRYLAKRLGLAQPRRGQPQRQVCRYVDELRRAGRLDVAPPRHVRSVDGGWTSKGYNGYRVIRPAAQTPCSHRRVIHGTSVPGGTWATAPEGPGAVDITCEHGSPQRQLASGAPACPLCRAGWLAAPGRARKTPAGAGGDHQEVPEQSGSERLSRDVGGSS